MEADSCARGRGRPSARRRPDVAQSSTTRCPTATPSTCCPRLQALDPAVPLVILTGHGSIDLAVQAIKEGAEQFLTKPVELPTPWP